MSHRELLDWQRFEASGSMLPDRLLDMHLAMISSLIVNRTRTQESEPVYPSDFFLIRDAQPKPLDDYDDGLTEAERAAVTWRGGS